jgi:hypothetical protein
VAIKNLKGGEIMITANQFKKRYQKDGNNYADYNEAMDRTYNDYGPYLGGMDLTYIGAYVRTLWLDPAKITSEHKKCLTNTLKKADKWAAVRSKYRI